MLTKFFNKVLTYLFGEEKDAYWLVLYEVTTRDGCSVTVDLRKIIVHYGKKPPKYTSEYDIARLRILGPFSNEKDALRYANTLRS